MNKKQTFDYLIKIEKEIYKFDGKELTSQTRKELINTINKLVKEGMFRLDSGNQVRIWSSKEHHDFNMTEDISIGVSHGVIHVSTDILWKTISGLDEAIRGD